jgi:hypothetical protein
MAWPCFWTEETGEVDISLRRYRDTIEGEPPCPGPRTHHDAQVIVVREPHRRDAEGVLNAIPVEEYADRPDWPAACGCGYVFVPEDHWQVNQEPLYRAVATGQEWRQHSLPVGAMYHAPWYGVWGVGADGIALMVVLPPERPDMRANFWHVDGPANHGDGTLVPNAWTRTGDPRDPPTLTVNPSIQTDEYHGYLHDGVLTDPL